MGAIGAARVGKAAAAFALVCVAGAWTAADAQSRPPRKPPVTRPRGPARLELGAGVGLDTAVALGERPAALRGADGRPFALFQTSTELAATVRIDARVGYALTPRYVLEGQFGFVRPEVRTAVSGDVEGGADESAAGHIDQYSVSLGMAVRLPVTFGGLTPFVAGGAGYVRELPENLPPIEAGYLVYAGGGVRRTLAMRPDRFFRVLGVRGDARWQRLDRVVRVLDRPRSQGSISGSLFVMF
jgi:hypothetical protein